MDKNPKLLHCSNDKAIKDGLELPFLSLNPVRFALWRKKINLFVIVRTEDRFLGPIGNGCQTQGDNTKTKKIAARHHAS